MNPMPESFLSAAVRTGWAQRTEAGVEFRSEEEAERLAQFAAWVTDSALRAERERIGRCVQRVGINSEIARMIMEGSDV